MFKTRLLSGIVLVILALFLIISGHEILLFATLAISCIGMFELYRVFKMEKTVLAGVGYLAAIVYYCNLQWKFLPDLMILFMAFLILLMFVFVFAYPKFHADQVMAAFFGFFYVAVMLSYVYQIRTLERGLYLAFLVFLCSWGCDTCAYCVGMLIGKHKMSPKLSPKKSVEASDRFILFYFPEPDASGTWRNCNSCCDCGNCRTDFHGRGSDSFCHQKKL